MLRKLLVAAASVCSAVAAFAGTSYAVKSSPNPGLRPNLKAAALPTVSLPEDEAIRINNLIGFLGAKTGITRESYSQVRVLTQTRVGKFLLVPGTNGACLVLADSASCGDPGSGAPGEAFLALVAEGPGHTLIGGGIADDNTRRVTFSSGGDVVAVGSVDGGVFRLSQVGQVRPGSRVEFNAE